MNGWEESHGGLGATSYYMHHGLAGSGSVSQPGLLGPTSIRSMSNLNQPLSLQPFSCGRGSVGSSFQVESSSISQHGSNVGDQGGMTLVEPIKRKRGRPRKYGPDGTVSLALSPMSSPPVQGSGSGAGSVIDYSSTQTQKRGRGRPPGTGKKQRLALCGEWLSTSAGMDFTPHSITISKGEDITTKIMSFSQQGPRAIVILSANGLLSTVTLRHPATSSSTVTYEGRFEILCLSGSYLPTGIGGSHSQSGGLNISLSSPDGRVIGGGVGGLLIAGSPVQVIVGSFIYGGKKTKNKPQNNPEAAAELELPVGDKQEAPSTTPPSHTFTSFLSGWPGSRQLDMRNADIDND